MERRPILLSSVMLRQNPHNVHEWHKRVKLFNGQPHKQILTYTEAVTTVDVEKVSALGGSLYSLCASVREQGLICSKMNIVEHQRGTVAGHLAMRECVQAVGKLHTLWIAFAKFYERHGDIENARVIFDKATQVRCPPSKVLLAVMARQDSCLWR